MALGRKCLDSHNPFPPLPVKCTKAYRVCPLAELQSSVPYGKNAVGYTFLWNVEPRRNDKPESSWTDKLLCAVSGMKERNWELGCREVRESLAEWDQERCLQQRSICGLIGVPAPMADSRMWAKTTRVSNQQDAATAAPSRLLEKVSHRTKLSLCFSLS